MVAGMFQDHSRMHFISPADDGLAWRLNSISKPYGRPGLVFLKSGASFAEVLNPSTGGRFFGDILRCMYGILEI